MLLLLLLQTYRMEEIDAKVLTASHSLLAIDQSGKLLIYHPTLVPCGRSVFLNPSNFKLCRLQLPESPAQHADWGILGAEVHGEFWELKYMLKLPRLRNTVMDNIHNLQWKDPHPLLDWLGLIFSLPPPPLSPSLLMSSRVDMCWDWGIWQSWELGDVVSMHLEHNTLGADWLLAFYRVNCRRINLHEEEATNF